MRVAAGGGLRSTVADLLRYARAHAAERDPAVRLAHRRTTEAGPSTGVALGWGVGRDAHGRRRLSHGGGTLGYSSFVLVLPDQGAAVVCLANQAALEGELERLATAIADGLLSLNARSQGGRASARAAP
jgi:CubicO group peptidase (beta-lactamase class C family)